jgi:hypothetical protein
MMREEADAKDAQQKEENGYKLQGLGTFCPLL